MKLQCECQYTSRGENRINSEWLPCQGRKAETGLKCLISVHSAPDGSEEKQHQFLEEGLH